MSRGVGGKGKEVKCRGQNAGWRGKKEEKGERGCRLEHFSGGYMRIICRVAIETVEVDLMEAPMEMWRNRRAE